MPDKDTKIAVTALDSSKILDSRRRSKILTRYFTKKLYGLNSDLKEYYQRANLCGSVLKGADGKLTQRYCNTRICAICNRLRTAKMITNYAENLKALQCTTFTTLTVQNCKKDELENTIFKMGQVMRKLLKKRRKYSLSGMRKFECTVNVYSLDFHPHIHLVHNGPGCMIIKDWMKLATKAGLVVNLKGQDSRELYNEHEIFKYFTKLFAKSQDKKTKKVSWSGLDHIIRASFNLRTFQPFGMLKSAGIWKTSKAGNDDDIEVGQSTHIAESDQIFNWFENIETAAWFGIETGESLTEKTAMPGGFTKLFTYIDKTEEKNKPLFEVQKKFSHEGIIKRAVVDGFNGESIIISYPRIDFDQQAGRPVFQNVVPDYVLRSKAVDAARAARYHKSKNAHKIDNLLNIITETNANNESDCPF